MSYFAPPSQCSSLPPSIITPIPPSLPPVKSILERKGMPKGIQKWPYVHRLAPGRAKKDVKKPSRGRSAEVTKKGGPKTLNSLVPAGEVFVKKGVRFGGPFFLLSPPWVPLGGSVAAKTGFGEGPKTGHKTGPQKKFKMKPFWHSF